MSRKQLLTLIFILLGSQIYGQGSKLEKKGEEFLKSNDYEGALDYFNALDTSAKQNDPLFSYYMGMIHYHAPNSKQEGIPYLETYLTKTDSSTLAYYNHYHAYYFLAKLYHLNYEFDKAEENYLLFLTKIEYSPNFSDQEKYRIALEVKRNIENCKFGKIAVKNPRNAVIENLGDTINSIYPEYAGVISQDEKVIFFTSRRPDTKGGKKYSDGGYYEDIYGAQLDRGSLFENKNWSEDSTGSRYFNLVTDFGYYNFHKVGGQVNSTKHDGSIQLAHSDSVLYFYRDHDIWSVKIDTTVMDEPEKLGLHVNSDQFEPSIFLSYDEQKLFIISDREGGFGGLDIYLSTKIDSLNWSEPKNLGPNINTPYDEDAPYLDPDGKTFYFSSKGHSSMGEYDIFRSKMLDSIWSTPINLGYPINTPANDIYFTMTSRYNRGYYSSSALGGKGDMDLYRITFADERDPVAEMVGYVRKGKDFLPAKSKITLTALEGEEEISEKTDSINGDYFLLLGHGKKYDMVVETDEFAPYHKVIEIPEQKAYFQLYQEVHHVHLYDDEGNIIGQKITVYNADGSADTTTLMYDFGFKNLALNNHSSIYSEESDVKFYLTEDSMRSLMYNHEFRNLDINSYNKVSFLKTSDADIFLEESYVTRDWKDFYNSVLQRSTPERNNIDSTAVTEVENVKGLFFTVQIGVYSREVPKSVFYNLAPINSQNISDGTIRYSTGQYYSEAEAMKRRDEIVKLGITDAFVTAYSDGKRITVEEANRLLKEEGAKILFDPNW